MPGPLPNPNARRRNKSSEWTTIEAPARPVVPKLPGRRWLTRSREAWSAWWSSPMASQWEDGDLPSLLLAVGLYDAALRGDLDSAKEFRQYADRFGLSPLARQRNRWHVAEGDEEKAGQAVATVTKLRAV